MQVEARSRGDVTGATSEQEKENKTECRVPALFMRDCQRYVKEKYGKYCPLRQESRQPSCRIATDVTLSAKKKGTSLYLADPFPFPCARSEI
jgi:hypothetical protein